MSDQESLYPILKFFSYDHLPEDLQKISKPFHDLANKIANETNNASATGWDEVNVGLRKLLEAKDCFVRAGLKPTKNLGYDPDIFYKILMANELGNNDKLILKFSDADGVRTGKSGYSFGVSQFDIKNNKNASACLLACGFTQQEIGHLLTQDIDSQTLKAYEAKLESAAKVVEEYDKAHMLESLAHCSHLLATTQSTLADKETIYHIADYHNQFTFSRDGKLHEFLKTIKEPITPDIILKFKLEQTAWGQKRPDDIRRRYDNIRVICNYYA